MEKKQPIQSSLKVLRKNHRFAPLIYKHGPPDLSRGKNPFKALARSIIYQQLSGKAAGTIYNRFVSLFGDRKRFPTPQEVSEVSVKKLRSAGLSAQKSTYLHDLAKKFSDGTINYRGLGRMTNEEIVEHLIQIKGVGEWTIHMFLIFTLNRTNILPTGDLGIRKGFQIVYRLKTLPDKAKMEQIALPWREHATVASWYLWKAADEIKASSA